MGGFHKSLTGTPAAAAKSLQSCPTLCNPIDCSPPGSPVPGILQARTLEWVAISFSSAWKWRVKVKSLSRVWLFTTPWTAAYQAPPPMGFSRQEYWSGVPLPSLTSPTKHDKRYDLIGSLPFHLRGWLCPLKLQERLAHCLLWRQWISVCSKNFPIMGICNQMLAADSR